MFYWFDPSYFVFLAPALLLSAWASWKVHHAYAVAREIPPSSGLTGAQAAEVILARYGMTPVRVAVVRADQVEPELLTELATHHRREEAGDPA